MCPELTDVRDHVTLQRRALDARWAAAWPGDSTGGGGVLSFDDPELPPGEVRFPELDAGTYRVIAEAPGCATLVTAPFELAQGEPPRALTLHLAPGLPARGRVLESTGAPAGGVDVRLRLGDLDVALGTTEEDGTYETRQLPAADVEGSLSARAFLDEVTVPLGPDRATLPDLVLPPVRRE